MRAPPSSLSWPHTQTLSTCSGLCFQGLDPMPNFSLESLPWTPGLLNAFYPICCQISVGGPAIPVTHCAAAVPSSSLFLCLPGAEALKRPHSLVIVSIRPLSYAPTSPPNTTVLSSLDMAFLRAQSPNLSLPQSSASECLAFQHHPAL